jgi:hypothetical protein
VIGVGTGWSANATGTASARRAAVARTTTPRKDLIAHYVSAPCILAAREFGPPCPVAPG